MILLSALENHVFSLSDPYLALGLVQAIEVESLTFSQTFQLKLELRLISSNCT